MKGSRPAPINRSVRQNDRLERDSVSPLRSSLILAVWILAAAQPALPVEAIKLHPDNPHYFLFGGQPTVLITSNTQVCYST